MRKFSRILVHFEIVLNRNQASAAAISGDTGTGCRRGVSGAQVPSDPGEKRLPVELVTRETPKTRQTSRPTAGTVPSRLSTTTPSRIAVGPASVYNPVSELSELK